MLLHCVDKNFHLNNTTSMYTVLHCFVVKVSEMTNLIYIPILIYRFILLSGLKMNVTHTCICTYIDSCCSVAKGNVLTSLICIDLHKFTLLPGLKF